MADEKMPWFRFWVGKYRGSPKVQRMGWAERGVYLHLLTWAAQNGGRIEDSEESLCDALVCEPEELGDLLTPKVRRCFDLIDGFLVSEHMSMPPTRPDRLSRGWLYILAPEFGCWWKLGFTSRAPHKRAREWESKLGPVNLIAFWRGTLGDELTIHRRLREFSVTGLQTREAYCDDEESRQALASLAGLDHWEQN